MNICSNPEPTRYHPVLSGVPQGHPPTPSVHLQNLQLPVKPSNFAPPSHHPLRCFSLSSNGERCARCCNVSQKMGLVGYVANVGTHNRYLVPPINRGPTFWTFECSIQLRNKKKKNDTRKRHAALSDLTSKSCIAFDFQSSEFLVLHSGFLSIQSPLIKDVSRFVCVCVSQEL